MSESFWRDKEKAADLVFEFQQLQRQAGTDIKAKRKLEEAVILDPENTAAYIGLGNRYLVEGNSDKAKESYLKVVELNGEDLEVAHNNIGVIFLRQKGQGFLGEAERNLRKSLELNPYYMLAMSNLGICLRQQESNSHEAELCFREVIDREPKNIDTHNLLVEFLESNDRLWEAKDILEQIIAQDLYNNRTANLYTSCMGRLGLLNAKKYDCFSLN